MVSIRITFSELNGPNLSRALRDATAREQQEQGHRDQEETQRLQRRATSHEEAARESQACSDTEGFLSQWAHGMCAREDRLAARIAKEGGTAEFPALFDLGGALVPARRVRGQYGWSWELLNSAGRRRGWFNESKARAPEVRRRNNAAKGFYVGVVRAPAGAGIREGEVRGVAVAAVRSDGGWSPDVTVVDNGQ